MPGMSHQTESLTQRQVVETGSPAAEQPKPIEEVLAELQAEVSKLRRESDNKLGARAGRVLEATAKGTVDTAKGAGKMAMGAWAGLKNMAGRVTNYYAKESVVIKTIANIPKTFQSGREALRSSINYSNNRDISEIPGDLKNTASKAGEMAAGAYFRASTAGERKKQMKESVKSLDNIANKGLQAEERSLNQEKMVNIKNFRGIISELPNASNLEAFNYFKDIASKYDSFNQDKPENKLVKTVFEARFGQSLTPDKLQSLCKQVETWNTPGLQEEIGQIVKDIASQKNSSAAYENYTNNNANVVSGNFNLEQAKTEQRRAEEREKSFNASLENLLKGTPAQAFNRLKQMGISVNTLKPRSSEPKFFKYGSPEDNFVKAVVDEIHKIDFVSAAKYDTAISEIVDRAEKGGIAEIDKIGNIIMEIATKQISNSAISQETNNVVNGNFGANPDQQSAVA